MPPCRRCGVESPDGANFCPACGSPLAQGVAAWASRDGSSPSSSRDVVGSTALGELLDPETVRGVMARYFATMTAVIERHGGTVEKYIGDAIMAVFGLPVLHEDDALRAVRAAVEMREALAALNVVLESERGVTIAARTGIETGEVVAGDATARQTLVTGDPVNTAARLEQAAGPGEILRRPVHLAPHRGTPRPPSRDRADRRQGQGQPGPGDAPPAASMATDREDDPSRGRVHSSAATWSSVSSGRSSNACCETANRHSSPSSGRPASARAGSWRSSSRARATARRC